MNTRANSIRERIKAGGHGITYEDVIHLALTSLADADKASLSIMSVADFHIRKAEAYARIAAAMKGS